MENNVILPAPLAEAKESIFRRTVIIINIIIPIYVINNDFIWRMALITNRKLLLQYASSLISLFDWLPMPMAMLVLVDMTACACIVDIVISAMFVVSVMCYSKRRQNFTNRMLLISICLWTIWNSFRVLIVPAYFLVGIPQVQYRTGSVIFDFDGCRNSTTNGVHRYCHFLLQMGGRFQYNAYLILMVAETALRMVSIVIVILYYKWVNVSNITHDNTAAEDTAHEEEGCIQHSDIADNPTIDIEHRNDQRNSWFTLTTVLIAANSIPLLTLVLPELPYQIADVLPEYAYRDQTTNSKPLLIAHIAANSIEIILSLIILACLWAKVMKTKRIKLITVVIWGAWHVGRVIVQFAYCIWVSIKIADPEIERDLSGYSYCGAVIIVTRGYFELVMWITCVLFVLITAHRELKSGGNIYIPFQSENIPLE